MEKMWSSQWTHKKKAFDKIKRFHEKKKKNPKLIKEELGKTGRM